MSVGTVSLGGAAATSVLEMRVARLSVPTVVLGILNVWANFLIC